MFLFMQIFTSADTVWLPVIYAGIKLQLCSWTLLYRCHLLDCYSLSNWLDGYIYATIMWIPIYFHLKPPKINCIFGSLKVRLWSLDFSKSEIMKLKCVETLIQIFFCFLTLYFPIYTHQGHLFFIMRIQPQHHLSGFFPVRQPSKRIFLWRKILGDTYFHYLICTDTLALWHQTVELILNSIHLKSQWTTNDLFWITNDINRVPIR